MKLATQPIKIQTYVTITKREYLTLAIPLIISGISTTILGAVDTAVVGRMPDPSLIGGVAVGALIFNTMYWLLGFLRVSTSGLHRKHKFSELLRGFFFYFFGDVKIPHFSLFDRPYDQAGKEKNAPLICETATTVPREMSHIFFRVGFISF